MKIDRNRVQVALKEEYDLTAQEIKVENNGKNWAWLKIKALGECFKIRINQDYKICSIG